MIGKHVKFKYLNWEKAGQESEFRPILDEQYGVIMGDYIGPCGSEFHPMPVTYFLVKGDDGFLYHVEGGSILDLSN